ncbi:hypothetical protein Baya_10749 [Bagarius yarrelli]|uniref:Uncharacterized protein n=1 Tax=Bagarius yarrelli TaxID=175774 RepID=A0A556UGD0_BAGYA|nr:hypothetical protein Baya_10749 [Bagarius yarrelli]
MQHETVKSEQAQKERMDDTERGEQERKRQLLINQFYHFHLAQVENDGALMVQIDKLCKWISLGQYHSRPYYNRMVIRMTCIFAPLALQGRDEPRALAALTAVARVLTSQR